MKLDDGSIKLLDFEFSCLNHIAFDFANLFAETVMEHGLAEPTHFPIAEPRFSDADLASLIGFYLDNVEFADQTKRDVELRTLVNETRRALLLSDYVYAMAALPLALEPIQKIRFIPYAPVRQVPALLGGRVRMKRRLLLALVLGALVVVAPRAGSKPPSRVAKSSTRWAAKRWGGTAGAEPAPSSISAPSTTSTKLPSTMFHTSSCSW